MHTRWRSVPLCDVVDAIYRTARAEGGTCSVYLHGSVLRVEPPGAFDVRIADDHCGDFRATEKRQTIERRLLSAFLLAVDE